MALRSATSGSQRSRVSGSAVAVKQLLKASGGGATASDVRSTERRAFRKLRSPGSVHAHNLLAYLHMAGVDVEETR